MSTSKYTEGYKDALAAVMELLEELVQDAFIEEEAYRIIQRSIKLELTPRRKVDDAYETRP